MHARTFLSTHALLAMLTAATLTSCSAADGRTTAVGDKTTVGDKRPSKSATTRAQLLSKAELRALTFQEADLPEARPGSIPVQDRSAPADGSSFAPASDPDCQKVHDIRHATTASTVVSQVINWKDGIYPGGVTLASYDDGEAERLFAELKRATGSCRTYKGDGWTGAYTSTMKTQKPPEAGDEAVQFREYSTVDAGKRDELSIVVRTGSVIATYVSLEIGRTPTFPTGPISKQSERIRDAQDK
ncbi:hypothetical protein ACFUTV_18070 [Streptomyces sp. NPDC057298]|uniref:hypothetical protein n=1 Tax=Streptomyces sp. NPDC057298 TaxID=3346091 RepID=UPI003644AED2